MQRAEIKLPLLFLSTLRSLSLSLETHVRVSSNIENPPGRTSGKSSEHGIYAVLLSFVRCCMSIRENGYDFCLPFPKAVTRLRNVGERMTYYYCMQSRTEHHRIIILL